MVGDAILPGSVVVHEAEIEFAPLSGFCTLSQNFKAFWDRPRRIFGVVFVFLDLDSGASCCVDDLAGFIEARGFVEAEDGSVSRRGG